MSEWSRADCVEQREPISKRDSCSKTGKREKVDLKLRCILDKNQKDLSVGEER